MIRFFGYDVLSGCFIHALRFFLSHNNCSLFCIRNKALHYIHFYVVLHKSFMTYSYEQSSSHLFFGNPFLNLKHFDNKLILRRS